MGRPRWAADARGTPPLPGREAGCGEGPRRRPARDGGRGGEAGGSQAPRRRRTAPNGRRSRRHDGQVRLHHLVLPVQAKAQHGIPAGGEAQSVKQRQSEGPPAWRRWKGPSGSPSSATTSARDLPCSRRTASSVIQCRSMGRRPGLAAACQTAGSNGLCFQAPARQQARALTAKKGNKANAATASSRGQPRHPVSGTDGRSPTWFRHPEEGPAACRAPDDAFKASPRPPTDAPRTP